MAEHPLLVAGATRPCVGEEVNGDSFLVTWADGHCRVAVIDGLGHGWLAAEAAQAALRALETADPADPAASLEACSRALSRTRGAAISIATIDWAHGEHGRLTFAGLGNVEARLLLPERERRLAPQRGIVGAAHRTLRQVEVALPADWLFALYSDGVSGRFDLAELSDGGSPPDPAALADRLVADWGRERDDATALVARPTTRPAGGGASRAASPAVARQPSGG